MNFGLVFPHKAVRESTSRIKDLAQAVELARLDYISAYDHVIGADVADRPSWDGPYTVEDPFREVFVLFGYIAAITHSVELTTGILILPQRQAVLVAKQAAELDLLLNGRLRLGVAIGWNSLEYDALGLPFGDRGARIEEQVMLLRKLWTTDVVTFSGRFHSLDRLGIRPRPIQQPIPIWLGGGGSTIIHRGGRMSHVLERIGRLGDGWISSTAPADVIEHNFRYILDCAESNGRNPDSIGLQVGGGATDAHSILAFCNQIDAWHAIGATHVSLTIKPPDDDFDKYLELIHVFGAAVAQYR